MQTPACSSCTCSAVNLLCRLLWQVSPFTIFFFSLTYCIFPILPPHTRIYTYNAYINTVPLIAHLTQETSEPREGQMVAAGWGLVCEHVCVCLCGNEHHQGRVEREQKVLCVLVYSCMSRFIPFLKWNCVDFLLLCIYFMFFICCLQVSSTHSFVQRFAVEMLSAVLGSTRLASCLALIRAGG